MATKPNIINFGDSDGEVISTRVREVVFEEPDVIEVGPRPQKPAPKRQSTTKPPVPPVPFGGGWDILIVAGRRMPGLAHVEGSGYERRTHSTEAAGVNGARVTQLGQRGRKVNISLKIWTGQQRAELERLLPILFPKGRRAPDYEAAARLAGPRQNGDGFLIDFDTTTQRSPVPTSDSVRAEQGEGLYVAYGRNVINSPAMTVEEARQRSVAEQERLDAELARPLDVMHPALRMFGIGSLHFLKASLLQPSSEAQVFEMKFECVDFIAPGKPKAAIGVAKSSTGNTKGGSNDGWDKIVNAIALAPPPDRTDSGP